MMHAPLLNATTTRSKLKMQCSHALLNCLSNNLWDAIFIFTLQGARYSLYLSFFHSFSHFFSSHSENCLKDDSKPASERTKREREKDGESRGEINLVERVADCIY